VRTLFFAKKNGRTYSVVEDARGRVLKVNRQPCIQSCSLSLISGSYYEKAVDAVFSHLADRPSCSTELLMLGAGGCTIPALLRECGFKGKIFAVENDEVIMQLSNLYFYASSVDELLIENARDFCRFSEKKFDIVIDDVFIDGTKKVKLDARRLLKSGGLLVINAFPVDNVITEVCL